MNIETLKSGFESYILRTTGISSEEYLEQYSDVSVWLNCAEFQEFLEDEYLQESIRNMPKNSFKRKIF